MIHVIQTSSGDFALFDPETRRTLGHYATHEDARRAAARSGYRLGCDLPLASPPASILAFLSSLGLFERWSEAHEDQLAAFLSAQGLAS